MKKIALIVGHNEKKKGAFFYFENKKIYEYDFWNDFLIEIVNEVAKSDKIQVEIFHRIPNVSYKNEIQWVYHEAKLWGADLSIECHFNSANKKASGYEVLYVSKRGKRIADIINNSFDIFLDKYRDRGSKKLKFYNRGYRNLTTAKYPSVIVEPFFSFNGLDFVKGGVDREKLKFAFIDFLCKV